MLYDERDIIDLAIEQAGSPDLHNEDCITIRVTPPPTRIVQKIGGVEKILILADVYDVLLCKTADKKYWKAKEVSMVKDGAEPEIEP